MGLLAWAAPQFQLPPKSPLPNEPPNILLIVADDLGVEHLDWHPVGAAAGNPAPTPVLSALAAEGLLFTDFYATPVCAPSRACLLTGRLPFRTGIGENPDYGGFTLSLGEVTLAEGLRDAGYQTGMFGKWHVSLERDDPNLQGFRHFDGTITGLKGGGYYDWPRVINGYGFTETEYNTKVATDSAIAWIQAQGHLTWFAYVAYSAPHKPYEAPPPGLDPITQATSSDPDEVIYHGMIEALDTEIGRLIAAVDKQRTLIMFLGDNGTAQPMAQSPLTSSTAKFSPYEGGVRVPAFVTGAMVGQSGNLRGLVHIVDVYRTLLDVARAPKTAGPIDSVSLYAPFLPPGQRWQPRRLDLFTERFVPNGTPPNGPFTELERAVRDTRYKLIRSLSGDELYDLWTDPWESVDLLLSPLTPPQQAAYDWLSVYLDATINS
jgi:arylsulfatase A-like enzyme